MIMEEIWKDIEDHNEYKISNFGRVKSFKLSKNGKILKITNEEYKKCSIDKKTFRVHLLVWDHFGDKQRNGRILQVDHIDNDKSNNRIDNLQLLNNRENSSKRFVKNKSSKFIGVSKIRNKWVSRIRIKNKIIILGYFYDEEQASNVYQKEKNKETS
jgi:hypothetical protein